MKNSTDSAETIRLSARKEFAMCGYEGARVDRIAEQAHINKAMIYYHYKNKEGLYAAVLDEMYSSLIKNVIKEVPEELPPEEQIPALITAAFNFITELDRDFVRIMLREISDGGAFFRKLFLPRVVLPMIERFSHIVRDGMVDGTIREIDPPFTLIQTMGSLVFFNALRIILTDTPEGNFLFSGNYFSRYRENLLSIIKQGILTNGDKK